MWIVEFLGYKIREKRKRKGLTQTKLAQMVDVANWKSLSVSIGGYEDGSNIPNAVVLRSIAVALECDINEFFKVIRGS